MRRLSKVALKRSAAVLARCCIAAPIALGEDLVEQKKTETGEEKTEVPRLKWLHVASEGDFTGHADGEFELNRKVFEKFIENFRADPRFKAGGDGVGINPVIPFDFEHASELDPTSGSIPATGAPAPAWALDLQVRDSEGGKAQLWCYADLGETIRTYIARNEYRHVSIAFSLDATDPVTSESVGPRLSSIAFTNHPFLRGLTAMQIAASAREQATTLRWYDPAGSPQQGIEYTRQCLGLGATADVNAVKAEVQKIAGFATNPNSLPPGVDVDDIFCSLRKIWSLPVSSTVAEITAEIDKAASQIPGASVPATSTPPAPPAAAPVPAAPMATDTKEITTMSLQKALIKVLSSRKPAALLSDDAAIEAEVLAAVNESADLGAVLASLGVKDASAALAAIPTLQDAKVKLEAALEQLNEALSMQAEVEQQMDSADVEAAASSKGLDGEAVSTALSAHRSSLIQSHVAKLSEKDQRNPRKLSEARKEGRKAFLSHYGVAPAGMERLLKNLVAGPNGTQLTPPGGEETSSQGGQRRLTNTPPKTNIREIDITMFTGANQTERLMNFIIEKEDGGKQLTHEQRFDRARRLRRQAAAGEIVILDVE